MKDRFSIDHEPTHRRSFLAAALAGGATALLTTGVGAKAEPADARNFCGNLSAADPLYLYQSLVWRLQPAAVKACSQTQRAVETTLWEKLEEVWKLADSLKARLLGHAKLRPDVEHIRSLAYVGYTNAEALKKASSAEMASAHSVSQRVITAEIVKASHSLSQQDGKKLDAGEWLDLQKLFALIEQIKTVYYPASVTARSEFDECLKNINKTIVAIEGMLTDASTSVVRGQKTQALRLVTDALKKLDDLPNLPVVIEDAPADLNAARDADEAGNAPEFFTRDQFKMMLEPVKDLIRGKQLLPRVSQNGNPSFSVMPAAYDASGAMSLSLPVDPSSVRAIVEAYFISGNWLQVVAVTAACLPLWSAYSRSEQRKVLIHSALRAVPRSRKLWEAAYYLNRLT